MNILVVDDDAVNRLLLRAIFTAEQMKVFLAVDGVEALAALEREAIDAIITDILMPKMDGYRLCYEVRTHPRFRHLPLIIYTATYTTPTDEQLSLDLGADRFLRKPSPPALLVDAVRQAVRAPRAILPVIPEAESIGLMRTYSERLVCKLEERNIALEAAREELRQMNQTLEARVEQRTAELEAANERLESFAYFVSHELRTPLRAVHGFAGILRDDYSAELSVEARRVVGVIQQGAERMGRLIEDLLNFSRLQRQSLRKQSLEIGDAARAAIEDLRGTCALRNVAFTVGAMPRAMGDWALLKQVFANLIGNAVKFTRARQQAKIEVGAREEAGGVTFFVKDNGVGFDPTKAGKLFSAFERLHLAKDYEGSGLGLGIVKMIVERHGGRAWAEAAPDQGATFYFTLGPDAPGGASQPAQVRSKS